MTESSADLRDAWMKLREHWKIEPKNGHIKSTPGYSMFRLIFGPIVRCFTRMNITGVNNVPRSGATILAANHLSHVDPILVIASSRRKTHYLAKDGHFKNFFLRSFMNLTGQIETQREQGGEQALSSAADVLESNSALGIFPEGTRSKRTEKPFLLPGKTGIARLAASYPDANVVPIALNGTRDMMMPQNHKLPRPWKKVDINYGKSMTWYQWLVDADGANVDASYLVDLSSKESHEIKSELASLYRKFTDQFMTNLKLLGAP